MAPPQPTPKVICSNLWKVFGPHPRRVMDNLSPHASKTQVLEETGHVLAVKNVSFEVQAGETFVVMGLSGSGKSTLVRCITRLIEPTAGRVIIDQLDVLRLDEKELR